MMRWGVNEDTILMLMRRNNENPMWIGKTVGRSLTGVYTRASRLGLTRQYISWGSENTKDIIRRHLKGESYSKIAKALSISTPSVSQRFYILHKTGEYEKYLRELGTDHE